MRYLRAFFGGSSAVATNIAGFVVICSFGALFASFFFPGNAELAEARKWLIGLIASALSFVFGAASKR